VVGWELFAQIQLLDERLCHRFPVFDPLAADGNIRRFPKESAMPRRHRFHSLTAPVRQK
jgi:hypothetical protein